MIKLIVLENFKCFEHLSLEVAPLTLLSGINGMGKSSFIQALLILRQSYLANSIKNGKLLLNDYLCSVGTPKDILFENASSEQFKIEISYDNAEKNIWEFDLKTNCCTANSCNENVSKNSLFNDRFQYLQAERTGPRNSFPMSDNEVEGHGSLGKKGEYCAHFLAQNERKKLPISKLVNDNCDINELRAQVEAWLSNITPSTRIHVNEYPRMDIVNLEFSFFRKGLPTENYRASNVGFGLTYSLPIFTAVLSSEPGSLIIIENPEAHLHPKGQVMMGNFLALAAHNGIQIILETHSDHVLNGIRIAAKTGQICPIDVALHFFEQDPYNGACKVVTPQIDKNGRLDIWPQGFFDEWDLSLDKLL